MKFIKEEISPANKTRYSFAIGKQEAQILAALLQKALLYMPKLFITQSVEARMRNMLKEIHEAVPKIEPGRDFEDFTTDPKIRFVKNHGVPPTA